MRGKGRPKLGDSETKLRTYKITEKDYRSFCEWCKSRGLRPSEVVRGLIKRTAKITIKTLIYEDEEFEKLAKRLLFQKLAKKFKFEER